MLEYIPYYGGPAEHWGLLPAARLARREILLDQNIKKRTGPALCVLCGASYTIRFGSKFLLPPPAWKIENSQTVLFGISRNSLNFAKFIVFLDISHDLITISQKFDDVKLPYAVR
jgi:hypothetical protein